MFSRALIALGCAFLFTTAASAQVVSTGPGPAVPQYTVSSGGGGDVSGSTTGAHSYGYGAGTTASVTITTLPSIALSISRPADDQFSTSISASFSYDVALDLKTQAAVSAFQGLISNEAVLKYGTASGVMVLEGATQSSAQVIADAVYNSASASCDAGAFGQCVQGQPTTTAYTLDMDFICQTTCVVLGPGSFTVGHITLSASAQVDYGPDWLNGTDDLGSSVYAYIDPKITLDPLFLQALGADANDVSLVLSDGVAQPGLGGVPEPAAWALMLMGFGLAGSRLRRRGQAISRNCQDHPAFRA